MQWQYLVPARSRGTSARRAGPVLVAVLATATALSACGGGPRLDDNQSQATTTPFTTPAPPTGAQPAPRTSTPPTSTNGSSTTSAPSPKRSRNHPSRAKHAATKGGSRSGAPPGSPKKRSGVKRSIKKPPKRKRGDQPSQAEENKALLAQCKTVPGAAKLPACKGLLAKSGN